MALCFRKKTSFAPDEIYRKKFHFWFQSDIPNMNSESEKITHNWDMITHKDLWPAVWLLRYWVSFLRIRAMAYHCALCSCKNKALRIALVKTWRSTNCARQIAKHCALCSWNYKALCIVLVWPQITVHCARGNTKLCELC